MKTKLFFVTPEKKSVYFDFFIPNLYKDGKLVYDGVIYRIERVDTFVKDGEVRQEVILFGKLSKLCGNYI